jgi:phage repressor protein C with HTH and peptisase S24 domain
LTIYDLDVQTGEISFLDNVSRDPLSTISFLGAEDCDFAVKVHGDSMTGKISNGAVVAVKELFDKDIIPFGHIFLIFTSDLRMVRYIKKSKKGDDYVKLSSNNNQFEDFEIKREKIIRLFMVKKILNDES